LSLKEDVWRSVVQAIEAAIPEYDSVNERVSFGHAQKARVYGASLMSLKGGMLALDAGIGPGSMSEALLRVSADITIVGLDASGKLLESARQRLNPCYITQVHFVRGVFEALPFREKCFHRIVSAYAFRDARDRNVAIHEFYRVTSQDGMFTIVDLGKPDNLLKRGFVTAYIRFLMPLIASFAKSGEIRGNPWRMIIPTYQTLGSNQELVQALKECFTDVKIAQFLLGGVIVVSAMNSVTEQFSP
jgi:demethylmenaquinone methyltransferase/2-methoxy-6-polyprenyl-1,4-benzoquinol methylase